MEPNIFSPRINQPFKDSLGGLLKGVSLAFVTLAFVLLPIFFVPSVFTSLSFSKVYMVSLAILISLVLISLSVLRSGTVRFIVPASLAFFWLFAVLAVFSAFLSGDVTDSLSGNTFDTHTAGFMVLMATVMTVGMFFSGQKKMVTRLLLGLGVTTIVLQAYHLIRLVFGPDVLSFGLFASSTMSPVGSFNDLAIFSGLALLLVLVLSREVTVTVIGKVVAFSLTISSLVFLSIINFYAVWLIIGFFALMMLLYLVSRDTWLRSGDGVDSPVNRATLLLVGIICVVSAIFVVSGDAVGSYVSRVTGITYLEVRPSVASTIEVTKSVLSENALLGIGPNRFEDAWRVYKNPFINQTVFWSTSFSAGSGYIPTLLATTGVAGITAILLFIGAFFNLAYRLFIRTDFRDGGWKSIGVLTFVAAVYLWLMSVLYVPGATILLLAALSTGLVFATYATVMSDRGVVIDVTKNRQYGFLLIASVLVVIITSILSAITISKQFWSGVTYAKSINNFLTGAEYSVVDQGLANAFNLYNQDVYVAERAQLRFVEIQKLSQVEATALSKQQYAAYLSDGINLAEEAIRLDVTNPTNYLVLNNFYLLLNPNEFEGLKERIEAVFAKMHELDPINPYYYLLEAQYKASGGDVAAARQLLVRAVELKNNYTDALMMLSQLDIEEGKVSDAIEITSAIVSIEPNNPTRYFQLGVLLAANNDFGAAGQAFLEAIRLDPNYANARYFLALTYLDRDMKDEALEQLNKVRETNTDNATVAELIRQVESGDYVKPDKLIDVGVNEPSPVVQEGDVTTSTSAPETNVVSPVNQVPAEEVENQ